MTEEEAMAAVALEEIGPDETEPAVPVPHITSVSYSRLVNLGDYQNEKLGASARVEEGDDPSVVLENLRYWVERDLKLRREAKTALEEIQDALWKAKNQHQQLQRGIEQMQKKWQQMRDLLHVLGLGIPGEYQRQYDDIPF